jgi:hydrogenase-4 component B
MVMVVIARTVLLFLVFWEVMSLSGFLLVTFEHERADVRRAGWVCAKPTVRMQHTGWSFSEVIAKGLLPRLLRPRTTGCRPQEVFLSGAEFDSVCPEPISERVYEPFFRRWADRFTRLRNLQQGRVNVYLFYMVLTVVLGLA